MRQPIAMALLAAAAFFSLATGSAGTPNEDAESVMDSTEALTNEAALVSVAVDDADLQATAEVTASFAAGRAGTLYQPAGCAQASAQGATVTYTLGDCTGPFGLVHVTGTVTVVYSVAQDGLHAHATGTGLTVNGATVNLDAQGVYSVSGALRQLSVTSTSDGTGPRGFAFTRTGGYDLSWDEGMACAGLDGAWSTTVLGRTWSASATDYTVCQGGCPQAGGALAFTGGLSGVTLSISFDGSATASWTTSSGKHGTLPLFCQ